MLLGTQGWRRFVEQESQPVQYRQKQHEKDVDRLLVLNGQLLPETFGPETANAETRAAQEVRDSYAPRFEPSQKKRLRAEERKVEVDSEEAAVQARVEGNNGERAAAARDLDLEQKRLASYQSMMDTIRMVGLPALLLALLVVSVIMLGKGVSRSESPVAIPYLAGAACSLVLFGLLGTWLIWVGVRSTLEPTTAQANKMAAQAEKADRAPMAPPMMGMPGGAGMMDPQRRAAEPLADGRPAEEAGAVPRPAHCRCRTHRLPRSPTRRQPGWTKPTSSRPPRVKARATTATG